MRATEAADQVPGRPGVEVVAPALAVVADRFRPTSLAREHTLPVLEPLRALLPEQGLPRGVTVTIGGCGATSLALGLAAAPTAAGSWAALVGLPGAGLAAAAELGVALGRVAVIDAPEPAAWPGVVAALLGAFDLVFVAPGHRIASASGRRLAARARERGSVLVVVAGASVRSTAGVWPEAPELRLGAAGARWSGLGRGHGHLRARRLVVEATGRRGFSRPRRAELLLPGPDGAIATVPETADAPDVPAGTAGATMAAGAQIRTAG